MTAVTTSKSSFEIKLNNLAKTVSIHLAGDAEADKVQDFINLYNRTVKQINPNEYDLVVDCRELKVGSQDMIDGLTGVLSMYKETGFNKVIFEIENIVVKMQINRVARMVNLTNAEYKMV